MKKIYIEPTLEAVELKIRNSLLAGSGGMGNGDGKPGNGYDSGDISYGHGDDFDWDDEEEY